MDGWRKGSRRDRGMGTDAGMGMGDGVRRWIRGWMEEGMEKWREGRKGERERGMKQ